ncbi:MAG: hypothetical protein SNJ63_11260 [Sphingomonadaceae bacterium]
MSEEHSGCQIHATALVSKDAQLGAGVRVGAFSIIEAGTRIGAGTIIGSHCHLGAKSIRETCPPLVIGAGSLVRSHSIFYEGSSFGDRLVTGHRVTVREGTIAGTNLQIGTLSDIQGDCQIGDYVRLHSNVHIGQKSTVGDFVWIFPYVVLTNDPTPPSATLVGCFIGDYAALATMSVVLPGVRVESDALVGAMTVVRADVDHGHICIGNPGKVVGSTARVRLRDSGKPAYPWRRHFHRGYPDAVVARWRQEFPDG